MASTMVKKVMLKIVADDGDSEAKLDKITAKADELGRLHPDIKVRIDTAAAGAKLAVLKHELKDAASAADEKSGLASKLGLLSTRARDSGSSILGLSDLMGAASADASMGSRAMSGFGAATGLLEAPMSGLIVGVGGLAAGLTSAGIGAAAFGLVAKSAISNVTPAVSAYETALNTSGKAAKTAMTQYQQYMGALSGPQREMARSMISAEGAWNNFVSSNTSGVSKIMSQGLGLLPKLIGSLQPFMAPVEHALHGIITDLGHGLDSSGFKSFIDAMAKASGPMLTDLAGSIGHVIVGIGGILKAFLPMSGTMMGGLDKITAKFAHWGATLTSHSGFQALVSMAKQDMPYVISIVKNLGGAFIHLGGSMTGLSTFANSKMLLQLADPLAKLVNYLSKANPALLRMGLYALAAHSAFGKLSPAITGIKDGVQIVQGISAGFQDAGNAAVLAADGTKEFTLGTKIAAAATKIWTGVQAAFDAVMDANPIVLVVAAIALLAIGITLLVLKCKPFREFWIRLWGDVEKAAIGAWHFLDNDVIHPIMKGVDLLVGFVRTHWKLLATIIATVLLGPVAGLVVFVATHWQQIRSLTLRLVGDVVGFFRALPGRIMGVLSSLPGQMLSFGGHIIMMLAKGIAGAAGSVISSIGSIAGSILDHIPHSPAKKGPLSGSGSPDLAGRKIGLMLAGGMRSSSPEVMAAAAQMAGAAAIHGGSYRPGGSSGGGDLVLRIEGTNQGLVGALVLALRNDIRVHGGGNVQRYLGH
jgi:hypothetical protein